MLTRWYWRTCRFRDTSCGPEPLDAFWVEATEEEAESCILHRLSPKACAEAKVLAAGVVDSANAEEQGRPLRPCCFLVARDLSRIDPLPANYPFHHMWNAYSPFRKMPAVEIANLEDLRDIGLPSNTSVES